MVVPTRRNIQQGVPLGERVDNLSTQTTQKDLLKKFNFSGGNFDRMLPPIIQEETYLLIPYEPDCETEFIKYGDDFTVRFILFSNEIVYAGRVGFCAEGKTSDLMKESIEWLKTIKATNDKKDLARAKREAALYQGRQDFGEHVGANGKIDALFVAGTLFDKDVIYFRNKIPFDGENHSAALVMNADGKSGRLPFDFNAPAQDSYPEVFEKSNEFALGMIDCLTYVENNNNLKCKLSDIDSSIHAGNL
jgi:hypothetical protein